jgi:hypothetical protein
MRLSALASLIILFSLAALAACGGAPAPAATASPDAALATDNPGGTITALFQTAVIIAQFTPVPSSTFTPPPPTATPYPPGFTPTPPTPDATATASAGTLEALVQSDLSAPLTIAVPSGWFSNNFNLPLVLFDVIMPVPFTYYAGSMAGGTATIAVLWGFENITPVDLADEEIELFNLWSDGVRLLVTGLLEPGCTPGLDDQREFSVGGRPAVGSLFSVVDCPDSADIAGWFAVLDVDGLNFAFFVYYEPREGFDETVQAQFQSILDTVRFDLSLLPTVSPPTVTP